MNMGLSLREVVLHTNYVRVDAFAVKDWLHRQQIEEFCVVRELRMSKAKS
jgi:hypothetical protein